MHEKTSKNDRTLTAIPRGSERSSHQYTEGDIDWLESLDLTDSNVRTALKFAYLQNDPKIEGRSVLGRSIHELSLGSEATLRERLTVAEERLKENPKHYSSRIARMQALYGLAYLAKEETPGA